jgi:hypothetical protein
VKKRRRVEWDEKYEAWEEKEGVRKEGKIEEGGEVNKD